MNSYQISIEFNELLSKNIVCNINGIEMPHLHKCYFHKQNKITHFCSNARCTLPMCSECLPIHLKQHHSVSQTKQIISFAEAQQYAITNLLNYIGGESKIKRQCLRRIQEIQNEVIFGIKSYFRELLNRIQVIIPSKVQAEKSLEKIQKGSLKTLIYFYSQQKYKQQQNLTIDRLLHKVHQTQLQIKNCLKDTDFFKQKKLKHEHSIGESGHQRKTRNEQLDEHQERYRRHSLNSGHTKNSRQLNEKGVGDHKVSLRTSQPNINNIDKNQKLTVNIKQLERRSVGEEHHVNGVRMQRSERQKQVEICRKRNNQRETQKVMKQKQLQEQQQQQHPLKTQRQQQQSRQLQPKTKCIQLQKQPQKISIKQHIIGVNPHPRYQYLPHDDNIEYPLHPQTKNLHIDGNPKYLNQIKTSKSFIISKQNNKNFIPSSKQNGVDLNREVLSPQEIRKILQKKIEEKSRQVYENKNCVTMKGIQYTPFHGICDNGQEWNENQMMVMGNSIQEGAKQSIINQIYHEYRN